MKFTVLERIMLSNILPGEGDITTLLIIRQLREELSFTEAEHAVLQFKQTDAQLGWQDGVEPKEIAIGRRGQALIRERLQELSDTKRLSYDQISLWERFMPKKGKTLNFPGGNDVGP